MTELRPLNVFLCHASGDKAWAKDLYNTLTMHQMNCWLDSERLVPGQDWNLEIRRAVRSADVVVVCLSTRAVRKSGYIQKELKYALDVADEQPEGTLFLIPVRLDDCEIPERMRHLHWVDSFGERGWDRLFTALGVRAETLGRITPNRGVFAAGSSPTFVDSQIFYIEEALRQIAPVVTSPHQAFEIEVLIQTGEFVGGDFYDIIPLDPARFCLIVADLAGKGLPAALAAVSLRGAARALATQLSTDMADVMMKLNGAARSLFQPSVFATVFFGRFDASTRHLTYVCGGCELPLVVRSSAVVTLDATGQVGGASEHYEYQYQTALGAFDGVIYCQVTIQLQPGDLLAVFTDGLTDLANGKTGEPFGRERLANLLQTKREQTAQQSVDAVRSALHDWSAGRLRDDLLLALIKVTAD